MCFSEAKDFKAEDCVHHFCHRWTALFVLVRPCT
jgi:hypothetical protein